jgi:hypothetical protein
MSIKTNTILKDLLFLLAEGAFIFISVYFAFVLNSHRIQKNHEHQRQQTYTALYRYFSPAVPGLKRAKNNVDSLYIEPFAKAYQSGAMPPLKKVPFFKSSINDHTWNAMLQAGGFDLLDIKLIRK